MRLKGKKTDKKHLITVRNCDHFLRSKYNAKLSLCKKQKHIYFLAWLQPHRAAVHTDYEPDGKHRYSQTITQVDHIQHSCCFRWIISIHPVYPIKQENGNIWQK